MCCMINTQVDWQPSPWFFQTPKTNTSDFPGQRRGARHSGVLVFLPAPSPKNSTAPVILTGAHCHHMLSLGTHASRPDQREWWKLGILWNSQISLWKTSGFHEKTSNNTLLASGKYPIHYISKLNLEPAWHSWCSCASAILCTLGCCWHQLPQTPL